MTENTIKQLPTFDVETIENKIEELTKEVFGTEEKYEEYRLTAEENSQQDETGSKEHTIFKGALALVKDLPTMFELDDKDKEFIDEEVSIRMNKFADDQREDYPEGEFLGEDTIEYKFGYLQGLVLTKHWVHEATNLPSWLLEMLENINNED